jgi:hypothetical protein
LIGACYMHILEISHWTPLIFVINMLIKIKRQN